MVELEFGPTSVNEGGALARERVLDGFGLKFSEESDSRNKYIL